MEKFKGTFLSFDELFAQSSLHLLSNNEKLLKTLDLVAECKGLNPLMNFFIIFN